MENMNKQEGRPKESRPEGMPGLTLPEDVPTRTSPTVNELLKGIREVTIEIKEMSEVIIAEIITGSGNPEENIKCPSPEFDSKPALDKLEYLSTELRDARAKYNKIIDVLR